MHVHFLMISCELAQDDELLFPKSTVKVTSKRRPANQAFGLDLTVREANIMAKPRHLHNLGMGHETVLHVLGKRSHEHTHTQTTTHREYSFTDGASSSMRFLVQVWRFVGCCPAPSTSFAAPCNQATGYLGTRCKSYI